MRPRGWHLLEKHVLVDGEPVSGEPLRLRPLPVPQRARAARARHRPLLLPAQAGEPPRGAPLERRLLLRAGRARDPARLDPRHRPDRDDPGGVRDGRDPLRAARALGGLNAGRWDYIFSVIKKFRDRPEFVLPDRAQVTMTVPFMRAYTELLVSTCHRRGAHAIGGMAAFIPEPTRPRGERDRARQGPGGQGARGEATASTAPGSPTPTSCRSRRPSSTRCSATSRTSLPACARTCRWRRRTS